ncbi:MAG: radical SAM protein, partial [Deltaproteobacteria bacterium]|nr:radical SAM protein [Deltaproteobacteria bacterium]
MIEARLYKKADKGYVDCALCSFRCHIADNKKGICGVRQNLGGVLYTDVYGKLVSRNIDPIEKKPLFHFLPGSLSYSIATVGCNFRCLHCQNFEISQMPHDQKKIIGEAATPEEVVRDAMERSCKSISYTYTEPTIFFEFAYDCSVRARCTSVRCSSPTSSSVSGSSASSAGWAATTSSRASPRS